MERTKKRSALDQTPEPLEILALHHEPEGAVLDSVASVLRSFYEVESAAFAMGRRGDSAPTPVVGLRVHAGYRSRLTEIFAVVAEAAASAGLQTEVLLLQEPSHIRSFRTDSLVFFPWRQSNGALAS